MHPQIELQIAVGIQKKKYDRNLCDCAYHIIIYIAFHNPYVAECEL